MKKSIFVSLLAISLCLAWQDATGKTWKELLELADSLKVILSYDSALSVLDDALMNAKATLGPEDSVVAVILVKMGRINQTKGEYQAALECYESALDIRRGVFGDDDLSTAACLNGLGRAHRSLGHYGEAEQMYSQALSIIETALGPQHPDLALSLEGLGFVCWRTGRFGEGEGHCLRAIEIEEGATMPDSAMLGELLNTLANIYVESGQLQKAESRLLQSWDIVEQVSGTTSYSAAVVLNGLAGVYWYQGRLRDAEQKYIQALEVKKEIHGPMHPEIGVAIFNLGVLSHSLGDYKGAESRFSEGLNIWRKSLGDDHPHVGSAIAALAELYVTTGRYDLAEQSFLEALAHARKALGEEHPAYSDRLHNLARLYELTGRYAEAEPLYRQALDLKFRLFGEQSADAAKTMHQIALLYDKIGKFEKAEVLFNQSREIIQAAEGTEHPDVAICLNDFAVHYGTQNSHDEAEPYLRRALEIRQNALGRNHPEVATTLINLTFALLQQEKADEADSLAQRAIEICQETLGNGHPLTARAIQAYAGALKHQEKYTEAAEHYNHAIDIYESVSGNDAIDLAQCLEAQSVMYREQGKLAEAMAANRRALDIRLDNFHGNSWALAESEALGFFDLLRTSAHHYLSCYIDTDSRPAEVKRDASEVILSVKGLVSEAILNRQQAIVTETDSTVLGLAEDLRFARFQLAQAFVQGPQEDLDEYRNQLDSLSRRSEEIESELSRQSASFRKKQEYKDITVHSVGSAFPNGSVLVEYLQYDFLQLEPDSAIPHYLVIVVTADGEPVITDLGEASEIDPLVDRYRQHMLGVSRASKMPTVVDRHNYKGICEELYRRTWQPVEKYVADKELVLIAPDGALNMVSFAGLMDGNGKYMIEKHAVHYLSAGRDVIRFKQEVEPGSGLFALGDPDYDATAIARLSIPEGTSPDSLPEPDLYAVRNVRSGCGELKDITVDPLPFTRSEVESVAASWAASSDEPVAVYFGSDASEEKFKAEAPGKRVIHLATHGYFLEGACQPDIPKRGFADDVGFVGENPLLLSGLFFAGANLHGEGADSVGAEDGILTAYEVSSMDLEGTELVVLSACETGLGEVKAGEGVYGLRRAFQIAGARTVVSALWPVSDKVTAEIMSRLYERQSESLPKTLRRLQLESINDLRSRNKADHPFSWGAFIALGDWR